MAQEFEGEPAQDPVHSRLKSSWLLTWLACASSISPVAPAREVMGLLNPQGSARDLAPARLGNSGGCVELVGGNESRTELRTVAGIEVLVVARPAGAPGGGDIYCPHSCGHGTLAKFVLLDLTGHGKERDAIARTLHELLHQYSTETSPAQLLEMLNRTYDRLGLRAILACGVGATFDPSLGLFRFSNAGQPRPLRWSARQRQWAFLLPVKESDCGLPLGVTAAAC